MASGRGRWYGILTQGEHRRTGFGPAKDTRMKTSTSARIAILRYGAACQAVIQHGTEWVRNELLGARPSQAREK